MPAFHALPGSATVLVAEGEALLRDQLSATLEQHGYDVITARTGEEAVMVLDRSAGEVDIVYANVELPKRSGLDVFLKTKSMKPGIRCILAAEPLGEGTRQSLFRIGVHAVLEKPFTSAALLEILQSNADHPPSRGSILSAKPTTEVSEQV